MKNTTIKPVLKTWVKPDINNEFGIYLRLTKDRKVSYDYLGIKCSDKLWNSPGGKVKNEHKQSLLLNSIIDQKVQEYRTKILSNIHSKINQKHQLQLSIHLRERVTPVLYHRNYILFYQVSV